MIFIVLIAFILLGQKANVNLIKKYVKICLQQKQVIMFHQNFQRHRLHKKDLWIQLMFLKKMKLLTKEQAKCEDKYAKYAKYAKLL